MVCTDPLFQVGNGFRFGLASADALLVLKNGNTTVSGTFTSSSDARLKTDIDLLGGGLAKLDAVQPLYFRFLDTERHPEGRQLGFIAQEIETQWPELVLRGNNGYLSVAYGSMSAVAIQAMKGQQEIMVSQDAHLARLEAVIRELTGGTRLGMIETRTNDRTNQLGSAGFGSGGSERKRGTNRRALPRFSGIGHGRSGWWMSGLRHSIRIR